MFKKFIKTIQEAQERRVAYWQLQHMSDSALKDIGITRGEIKSKFQNKDHEKEKLVILKQIKVLELDHDIGNISLNDFQVEREILKGKAKKELKI